MVALAPVQASSLIVAAGVPIAAPSANKFGHVSPTRPGHVMDDLGEEDVWVVDPALGGGGGDEGDGGGSGWEADGTVCDVGVESTVAILSRVAARFNRLVYP